MTNHPQTQGPMTMSRNTNKVKKNKPRSVLMVSVLEGIRQGVRNRAKSWGGKGYDRQAFKGGN